MLSINNYFPLNYDVVTDLGTASKLSELLELPAVVYFYPKDMTPGCTIESCAFRDNKDRFKSVGFNIYGISSDSKESHKKFSERYTLNFPLFTDIDNKLQETLGILVRKNIFGRKTLGTLRSTFLLDSKGKIIATWGDSSSSEGRVNVQSHASDVLDFIQKHT